MAICKECKKENLPEYTYCINCGTLLPEKEENIVISSSEIERKKKLLDDFYEHGYAPLGKKLITEEEFNSMTEAQKHSLTLISELTTEKEVLVAKNARLKAQNADLTKQNSDLNSKLSTIYSKGYAPSGMRLISDAEYNKLISTSPKTKNISSLPSWILWLVGVVFFGCLGWFYLSSNLTSSGLSDKALVDEKLSLPDDLAGYYMVKERDGKDGKGVAAKILQEEGQYSMSVYSSSITRKYFFAYNPETGILSSEELGNGKVEYVGKIDQIKISFEGWILVK